MSDIENIEGICDAVHRQIMCIRNNADRVTEKDEECIEQARDFLSHVVGRVDPIFWSTCDD